MSRMTPAIIVVGLLVIGGIAPPAFSANITIPDTVYSGTGWYGNREDQEVEPNCATGQIWDLEAFLLNGKTLTMVGGFNFRDGQTGSGRLFASGDIFLDTDGDAQYGVPNRGSGSGGKVVNNAFGYDYVIDLDFSRNIYNVIQLVPEADVVTTSVYFAQNDFSNPWRYSGGGTPVSGWQGKSFSYQTGLTDADTGFLGGRHNAVSVDLGFLGAGTVFTTHFTMECGNDDLMGRGTVVPEPGAMLLLGTGLIGTALYGRRKFRK